MERERNAKGQYTVIHRGTKTRLYRVWCAMKERCTNPHQHSFPHYGGRGIKVCDEWVHDFGAFREWSMANGYEEGLTIDRIDGNGNYEPSNCRWVTTAVQNRNYSRNHNITYQGETHCIKEWSEITGIHSATILMRIKRGKSLDEIFMKGDGRSTRWQKQNQSSKS